MKLNGQIPCSCFALILWFLGTIGEQIIDSRKLVARINSNSKSTWKAVSMAAAFGDRVCILSNGKVNVNISSQYITSCDKNNYGCWGGYMDLAHDFLKTGVITGGDYDSDVGCQPYETRPCRKSYSSKLMPCVYSLAITPKCRKKRCINDWYHSQVETEENTFKATSWELIQNGKNNETLEYSIRKNLHKYGPITAAFDVHFDFFFYKSGVYVPLPNQDILGGHAVRLVGWGVENNTKYWLFANSWSRDWGDDGFFKMIRGVNACEIEKNMYSAMPEMKKQ